MAHKLSRPFIDHASSRRDARMPTVPTDVLHWLSAHWFTGRAIGETCRCIGTLPRAQVLHVFSARNASPPGTSIGAEKPRTAPMRTPIQQPYRTVLTNCFMLLHHYERAMGLVTLPRGEPTLPPRTPPLHSHRQPETSAAVSCGNLGTLLVRACPVVLT